MEPFTWQETLKFYIERAKWYVKQMLPLTYATAYTEDGQCDNCEERRIVTVWKMWFGRCYNIREWEVVQGTSGEVG